MFASRSPGLINPVKVAGFTLVEVMLALAVFAIAGTALMKVTSANLSSQGQLEQNTIASWVAANRLVEVNLENNWPPQNNKKGKMEMAEREWFWQQKVIKTEDNDMRAVVIEVRPTEKSDFIAATLMTYVSKKGK
jgi:general secretion pathway protein I